MSIVAVDTGGTFTDIVFMRDGKLHVLKVPSTPEDPARAVIEGIAGLGFTAGFDLTHGSTVATNALLERRGARVALITNAGFEDIIEIGRQNRPQLYALSGSRPPALVPRAQRHGISGRMDYHGNELEPVADADVVALKERVGDADALAVCLLHSYANPAHERAVAAALATAGQPISLSSNILPEYREYERTATTVVNAYVAPLMHDYLSALEAKSGARRVRIMGSGGGTVPVAVARDEPVHTVLSGPAGGVAGALAAARAAGVDNIISFDMGGTSTDVSLCPGMPLHTREFVIAGMPVAIPVLDIHTVGAGGGSIAWIDTGGALRVGPRSAGARPGPICYGRGGERVTVTDANVWLGRLPADAFLGGEQLLQRAPIEAALRSLGDQLGLSVDAVADGIITVANSTMEAALRVISVERGYDPLDFTLVAFGGAAGLHAADLAERLGIPRILVPLQPGVLSAYGMLASPVRKAASRTVLGQAAAHADVFADLERGVREAMRAEGLSDEEISIARAIDARYHGQSHELRVAAAEWQSAFQVAHERRYGYANADATVEAVTLRVDATGPVPELPPFAEPTHSSHSSHSSHLSPVVPRTSLGSQPAAGPLVVAEYSSTTWVPAGWNVRVLDTGALILESSRLRT